MERWYRGVVARGNYRGMDRVDVQYGVKEACREMSSPTVGGQQKWPRTGKEMKRKWGGMGRAYFKRHTHCIETDVHNCA